ncbi:MAG: UbiD family decarboxylase, partial [Bacteroidia bacterium]
FGDHFGYYSLQHEFPLMRVHKVWHRKDAIWPFTVVGRPPQEDTSFGALVHELTGEAIPDAIPGIKEVHAVDAAGVHPLLFAIGSERYTPYLNERRPAEILTLANHILGFGQLSLAKYLFIAAQEDAPGLHTHDIPAFLQHILERIDLKTDLHFHTNTSIDTLDYSGTGLNAGSKLVLAAAGNKRRTLAHEKVNLNLPDGFREIECVLPGILSIQANPFTTYENAQREFEQFDQTLTTQAAALEGFPLIIISDDAKFTAQTLNNFLWVAFTRSNPSHDVYGVGTTVSFKHWGCQTSLVIDARKKPHHAPPLELDPDVEKQIDRLFTKNAVLGKWG